MEISSSSPTFSPVFSPKSSNSVSPTEEQQIILQKLEKSNVVVSAVAGSGKTTTILFIAQKMFQLNCGAKILVLTYNKKLQLETEERLKSQSLTNVEVKTFHAFGRKYFLSSCQDDKGLDAIVSQNLNPTRFFEFQMIIIDEAQDLNPLYYNFVSRIFVNNKIMAQLCILGDPAQCLYDYQGSDVQYLKNPEQFFSWNGLSWDRANLNQSFRVPDKIAEFVNVSLLQENRIQAIKKTAFKPRYRISSNSESSLFSSTAYQELEYYLNLGYSPSDIFVLAPSVLSNNSPIKKFENLIKTRRPDINIFVSSENSKGLDLELTAGKLVFSTFHSTKGLERKVVMVFGFDSSYFEYYNRNCNTYQCPNPLYVACTRALERLTLFHSNGKSILDFIQSKSLETTCEIIGILPKGNNFSHFSRKLRKSVTSIIRHVSFEQMNKCLSGIKVNQLLPARQVYMLPLKISQKSGMESVSDLIGITIPAYFEYRLKGKSSILENLAQLEIDLTSSSNEKNGGICPKFAEQLTQLQSLDFKNREKTVKDFLWISNLWLSFTSGYVFKLFQIDNYDWLDSYTTEIEQILNRMYQDLNLSDQVQFEVPLSVDLKTPIEMEINGYLDCRDQDRNFEFKCVEYLTGEHLLQLILYLYLNEYSPDRNVPQNTKIEKGLDISYRNLTDPSYEKGEIFRIHPNGNLEVLNSRTLKIERISSDRVITDFSDLNSRFSENKKYLLYNILSGELHELIWNWKDITDSIHYLLNSKFSFPRSKLNTNVSSKSNSTPKTNPKAKPLTLKLNRSSNLK